MSNYHQPVMLDQCIQGLNIQPDGVYVDVTFGGGGHSRAILDGLGEKGRLVAFDQDPDARSNAFDDPRFLLIPANFSDMKRFLKFHGVRQVDGILADFGVSSHQFDTASRGFSTRFDGPLDMRMNPAQGKSAADVINTYGLHDLKRILRLYGELKNADRLAQALVAGRDTVQLKTTQELKELLEPLVPERYSNKLFAQVFQALRIEVNQELDVIRQFLEQAADVLVAQGRLVVLSYHSLEDRLVKNFIRAGRFEGEVEKDFFGNPLVSFKKVGKLQVATAEEIKENSRARSAKLRIAERL